MVHRGRSSRIRERFGLKRLDVKKTDADEVTIDAEINPKKRAKEKFKKSQISKIRDNRDRQEACEKAGYHGDEIETRGGSNGRAETKAATDLKRHRIALDKAEKLQQELQVDIAALEATPARLEANAESANENEREDTSARLEEARGKLRQSRDKMGGIQNSIAGIAHEERAAEQISPDRRNVVVICALCKGLVTDLDLVKKHKHGGGATSFEAKASAQAVKPEQIRKQIKVVKALYGEASKVMLAIPSVNERDRRILEEKFASAGMDVPEIQEIE